MTNSLAEIVLQKGREESVLRCHPWVFSGALQQASLKLSDGTLVKLVSAEGQVLGIGHYFNSSIAVKLLSFKDEAVDEGFFYKRVGQAVKLREALGLVGASDTNAYRLVHAEGDGLPGLIVDIMKDVAVVELHSVGYNKDIENIVKALRGNLKEKIKGIYLRGERDTGQWLWRESAAEEFSIKENGFSYIVNINRGQKTGFFLDQRISRHIVAQYASNRTVLDCFCYSGGFAVNALGGGARSVTCVDASSQALDLAKLNIKNNFKDAVSEYIEADCLQYVHKLDKEYDLIVLDPPAFVKHRGALSGGTKGYETINYQAMKQILPNGILATFSCSQLMTTDLFRKMIFKSAKRADRNVKILGEFSQSPCHPISIFHPEGEYLKGMLLWVE